MSCTIYLFRSQSAVCSCNPKGQLQDLRREAARDGDDGCQFRVDPPFHWPVPLSGGQDGRPFESSGANLPKEKGNILVNIQQCLYWRFYNYNKSPIHLGDHV